MTQGTLASVLAGTTTNRLADLLAAQEAPLKVVRAMPNTPSAVGKGMAALSPGPGAQPADMHRIQALFAAVGEVCTIDESLMDAFTAVAGSGPAYLFYLTQAMVQGALEVGFDPDLAHRLLESDPRPPQELRAAVTSKGGTTFAATETFDSKNVANGIVAGIIAARNRGQALANKA
jgi:pyrroline-5-carboxylate reductase